jgi:hypothetical protein
MNLKRIGHALQVVEKDTLGLVRKAEYDIKLGLTWLDDPKHQQRLKDAFAMAANGISVAVPAVEDTLTALGGGSIAPDVGAVMQTIGVDAKKLSQVNTPTDLLNTVTTISGATVRGRLSAILPTLDHGLNIAGRVVHTEEELAAVPDAHLQAMVAPAVAAQSSVLSRIASFLKSVEQSVGHAGSSSQQPAASSQ